MYTFSLERKENYINSFVISNRLNYVINFKRNLIIINYVKAIF